MRPSDMHPRATVAFTLLLLAGCAQAPGPTPAAQSARCLPSRATVTPTEVKLGAPVRLSAPPFSCKASYGSGKTYQVSLNVSLPGGTRAENRDLGFIPVQSDGSFDATLTVPTDVPTGGGTFFLHGSAYDLGCQDTVGGSGSCGGYSAYPGVHISAP